VESVAAIAWRAQPREKVVGIVRILYADSA
jgi:hypothetical protein